MKTISNEQVALIEDAANAGLLGNLLPAIIEKDIHVTDALACIASVGSLRHRVVNVSTASLHLTAWPTPPVWCPVNARLQASRATAESAKPAPRNSAGP